MSSYLRCLFLMGHTVHSKEPFFSFLVFRVADILNDANDLFPTNISCFGYRSILNSKAKDIGKYDKYINHVL